ncbi:Atrial natriuretic peptide-converting enzyme [Chelonia mydas]|uniref:Atrial natriuretic peptide-converting enzyme n=1 Tax=Chelonia mydas TaxID=8469 RepID=M7AKV4_CHEMY|nr:Atrial natriuretic peptide-converting enzyme [Chelonia mydas]
MICDGFPDCPDKVDEKNCSFCKADELECASHDCVPRELWCDGQLDCMDNSDEWNCVTLSKTTSSLAFLTIHRSATDYHVCADEWQEKLSQLACNQMGLGPCREHGHSDSISIDHDTGASVGIMAASGLQSCPETPPQARPESYHATPAPNCVPGPVHYA